MDTGALLYYILGTLGDLKSKLSLKAYGGVESSSNDFTRRQDMKISGWFHVSFALTPWKFHLVVINMCTYGLQSLRGTSGEYPVISVLKHVAELLF
jgi:hypothetical protein